VTATLETPEAPVSARAHHLPVAGVVVVALAVLAAGSELLGDGGRLAAVLVLQAALVAAWVVGTAAGGAAGTAVIGLAASVGADVALEAPARPTVGGLLAVIGPGFLAVVLNQMLRRRRDQVVTALAGGVLLVCAVAALSTALLVADAGTDERTGSVALLAVGAALLVQHLVDLVLPRPQLALDVPRGLLGLVLAVVAAAGVAYLRRDVAGLVDGLSAVMFGALIGAVATLVAVAGSYVAVEAELRGRRGVALAVAQALLPIAACAPVALALQSAL
jgi:hypothetical protein